VSRIVAENLGFGLRAVLTLVLGPMLSGRLGASLAAMF
jgi:hypothetical protein